MTEEQLIQVLFLHPDLLREFDVWLASRGLERFGPIPDDDPDAIPTYGVGPTQATWDRLKKEETDA